MKLAAEAGGAELGSSNVEHRCSALSSPDTAQAVPPRPEQRQACTTGGNWHARSGIAEIGDRIQVLDDPADGKAVEDVDEHAAGVHVPNAQREEVVLAEIYGVSTV
ncbi:hypothetical protein ACVWWO_004694 [Bradyrhizobium sp. F1.13.1]